MIFAEPTGGDFDVPSVLLITICDPISHDFTMRTAESGAKSPPIGSLNHRCFYPPIMGGKSIFPPHNLRPWGGSFPPIISARGGAILPFPPHLMGGKCVLLSPQDGGEEK